jgi:hypothetical protein
MYNAPYDLGCISNYPGNSFRWTERGSGEFKVSNWILTLYGYEYEVKRITNFRNSIRPHGKKTAGPPVIDLLKLWSLLIDDGEKHSIGLKAVAERDLGLKMIHYSPEAALTREYQAQDVEILEKLWLYFMDKIKDVGDIAGFSFEELAAIKTPASFSKYMYAVHYPSLRDWKKENDAIVKEHKLGSALEKAYHGGITLCHYRGKLENVGWVVIKGAYSTAIMALNTDLYLKFDLRPAREFTLSKPLLCKVRSNFMFKTINSGLKMYALRKPCVNWIWNYDIEASKYLYRGYKFEILEIWEPVTLNPVGESLPGVCIEKKNKSVKGSTLYTWYKYCSNTSYGIKAQRRPFETAHTNMVIAGMITSRVHLCLAQIINTIEEEGFKNVYNDTDSCGFTAGNNYDKDKLIARINGRIQPLAVEHDGYYRSCDFISLKRYICTDGDKDDKIRVHGRGRYSVTASDIFDYVRHSVTRDGQLTLRQLSANTPIGLKMIQKLYRGQTLYVLSDGSFKPLSAEVERYSHPFMFVKDIPTERTYKDFLDSWYRHLDVKLSWKKETGGSFFRSYHTFPDDAMAVRAFETFSKGEEKGADDSEKRFWDREIAQDFGTV